MERGRRIELLALAWKAKVLPLYEPRNDAATGGEGWIRTSVLVRGQIYSLLPLTTRPPLQLEPQIMPWKQQPERYFLKAIDQSMACPPFLIRKALAKLK